MNLISVRCCCYSLILVLLDFWKMKLYGKEGKGEKGKKWSTFPCGPFHGVCELISECI